MIFLSYARDDDEPFVMRLYHDLVQLGFDVWWDRKSMPSRGNTFLKEIADVISESDRLIAICGPAYASSSICRAELDHAHKSCTVINPLLRLGDYSIIPSDIAMLHTPDFRKTRSYTEAFQEFMRILKEDCVNPGVLYGVPALPEHYFSRSDDLFSLAEMVLSDAKSTAITSTKQTTSLQGMGGIGKSVVAAAFCRDCETRRVFFDGVFWLSVGQYPTEAHLLSLMRIVGTALGDDKSNFVSIDEAKSNLGGILDAKSCLLVLDNVWDVQHTEPFLNALGPRCRILITTRDKSISDELGRPYYLDTLSEQAALQFLANWSNLHQEELPDDAIQLANECGYLPFALALCGAMICDGYPWDDLLEALQEADLKFMEVNFPNYPYPNVFRALKVSIEALPDDLYCCYIELLVFSHDTDIPEATLEMLWGNTRGLNPRQVHKIISSLEIKSLLNAKGIIPERRIQLHDLHYDYLRSTQTNLDVLHKTLLDVYAEQLDGGWMNGPDDGYYYQKLPYHLIADSRLKDLQKMLLDITWIKNKLDATQDTRALIEDYQLPEVADKKEIQIIHSTLVRIEHIISQHPEQLWNQIYGRLGFNHSVSLSLFNGLINYLQSEVCFVLLHSTLNSPTHPFLRTFLGHTDHITCLAVSSNGHYALSGSSYIDGSIRLWNLATGECEQVLENPESKETIWAISFLWDDKFVIAGSGDGKIRLWELETSDVIRIFEGHSRMIAGIAVLPDEMSFISSYPDNTLRHWDIQTGTLIREFYGHTHPIHSVSVTPNGRYALSVDIGEDIARFTEDHIVYLWEISSGKNERVLESDKYVENIVAVTNHQALSISSYHDGTSLFPKGKVLRLWDFRNDDSVELIKSRSLRHLSAIIPDEQELIIAKQDKIEQETLVRVNWKTGQIRNLAVRNPAGTTALGIVPGMNAILSGSLSRVALWDIKVQSKADHQGKHAERINAIAFTLDRSAVTASDDGTLRVWDVEKGMTKMVLDGHSEAVNAVDILPNKNIALSGSDDKTLRLWDLSNGDVIRDYHGHTDYVNVVKILPDGQHALSGDQRGVFKIWDLSTGAIVRTLRTDRKEYCGIASVALLADSRRFLSATGVGGTLDLWDFEKGFLHTLYYDRYTIIQDIKVIPVPDSRYVLFGDRTLRTFDIEEKS